MTPDQPLGFCDEPNCEDYWIECSVCGAEFCSKCFPNSRLCPDCAETAIIDDDEEDDPDFEDAPNLDALLSGETLPDVDDEEDPEERE